MRTRRLNKGKAIPKEIEQHQGAAGKIFNLCQKTPKLNNIVQDYDVEQAGKDVKRAIKSYKNSHKLSKEKIIYKVLGGYHQMRDSLNERGWVENDWEPKYDKEKFISQAWEFLYCIYNVDAFRN